MHRHHRVLSRAGPGEGGQDGLSPGRVTGVLPCEDWAGQGRQNLVVEKLSRVQEVAICISEGNKPQGQAGSQELGWSCVTWSVDESPLNLESAQVNHPQLNTRLDRSVALNLSSLGDVTACISVLLPKMEKHDVSNPGRERDRERGGREGGREP